MIGFRDMTFCDSDCTNTECNRNITEEVKEAGTKWWGSPEFPIAVSNFSNRCEYYVGTSTDNNTE